MSKALLLLASLVLVQPAFAQTGHVVDLGHPLSESDPTWTGEKVFSRTETATIGKDGYTAGKFSNEEHFGTHFDAPAHFGGEWTVDHPTESHWSILGHLRRLRRSGARRCTRYARNRNGQA